MSRYLDINSDKKAIFQELLEQLQFVRKEKQKNELRKEIGKLKRSLKELKGDDLKASEKKQAQMNQALSNLNKQVSEDPALAQLNLEKACLNFIQKGEGAEDKVLLEHSIDIGKALKQKTSHTTFASSEFAKDVEGLIKDFEEKIKSKGGVKEGLKVVFTDHSIDILLCGTDVSGSCQRVEGDPNLNKGLLGYLVDGKNRLLAIKEGDKIIARCMLSLLWDGEKPVIYRERFYPDTTPENYKNALNILAKKVAKKLNAPLTSNDAGTLYGKNLEALGGSAPYEYSDGSGGVKKDGCYTIIEAKLIV